MEATTNTTNTSAPRTVRINWLKFIFYSWKRISKFSRFILIANLLFVTAEIATGIVILALSRTESCEQPLQTYIIVYIVKVAISIPFFVGQHFERAERKLRIQRQRERDRHREEQVRQRRQQRRERRRNGQPEELLPSNASIQSTIVEPRSNTLTILGERFRSLVDLFSVLWFIVGNYMLFSSKTCHTLAPKQYYTTLAYILINYLIIIIPLIFCTSVVFCLPCVLVVMRTFHLSDDLDSAEKSERQEDIEKIPIYRYKDSEATSEPSQRIRENKKKRNILSLFHFRHDALDATEKGHYDEILINPKEDALCCICLSEYEDSDLIMKLWCGHHFHKSCLTEWLTLNKKCPLCKQDFRGKEYEQDSEEEEEDEEEFEGMEMTRVGHGSR